MPPTNRATGRPVPDHRAEVLEVRALEEALRHPPKVDPVDVTVTVSIARWRGRAIHVSIAPDDVAVDDA